MGKAIHPYGIIGFVLTAVFAVAQRWTLPEVCWGAWLAALVFTWGCIVTAPLQIIFSSRSEEAVCYKYFPSLRRLPPGVLLAGMTVVSLAAALLAFYIYSRLFAFYGIFLSVFAQMEPADLLGRNGFINSDFFTPVAYLISRYWPMALGILIFSWEDLFRKNPWKRLVMPFEKEIVRLHVLVVATPFVMLIAYVLLRKAYEPAVIVVLLGLLYLFPKSARKGDVSAPKPPERSVRQPGALLLPVLLIVVFTGIYGFYAMYPEYIGKMDFTRQARKPGKARSVARTGDSAAADRELRRILRKDHSVRSLSASEDGMRYAAAPDGIYAFVEPDYLFDASRLVLNRQFRKDAHFEIFKEHDGGKLVGYISNADDDKMKNRRTWTDFRVTLFNSRWPGAPVLYCVPLGHLQRDLEYRQTPTDRGKSALALEIVHR